jgi:hypothetical protein
MRNFAGSDVLDVRFLAAGILVHGQAEQEKDAAENNDEHHDHACSGPNPAARSPVRFGCRFQGALPDSAGVNAVGSAARNWRVQAGA